MDKKMILKNIVQVDNRGTLVFQEVGKDKKVISSVAVQFTDPKEAAKYEQGKTYSIVIALTK